MSLSDDFRLCRSAADVRRSLRLRAKKQGRVDEVEDLIGMHMAHVAELVSEGSSPPEEAIAFCEMHAGSARSIMAFNLCARMDGRPETLNDEYGQALRELAAGPDLQ